MLRRVLSFILVFSLAFNFLCFGAFAAGTDAQLFCPNCNSFQPQGVVTAHSYCPKCGCSLMSLGGGGSRGGGAGRRDIPKKYYTQGSGNDGKYSVSSGSTLYYSIDNTVNKTLNFTSYNRTTNNYTYNSYTYNNYTYNNEYNYYTYNINNQYYYVTNNYTYVTISYPNGTQNDEGNDNYDNVDIYYQLPDGRNSSYLTVDQVWGEYFIYNAVNYQSIMEDDGRTAGLWHLDGNTIDESYHPSYSSSLNASTYTYDSGRFDTALIQKVATASSRNVSIYGPPSSQSDSYTISFWTYYSSTSWRWSNSQSDALTASRYYPGWTGYAVAIPTDVWVFVVLQCNNISAFANIFVDGKLINSTNVPYYDNLVRIGNNVKFSPDDDTVFYTSVLGVDEVRVLSELDWSVSSGIQQQPWDSNLVFVAPSDPQENDVGIMSEVKVSTFRVGGVRPTYPSVGAVYVALENGIVKSIQQWANNQWQSVSASIYTGGSWVDFEGYDLVNYGNPEDSEPPDTGADSGGSGDGGGGSDGDSIWDTVAQGIANLLGVVGDLIGGLLSGILQLLTSVLSSLTQAIPLVTEFAGVITQFYSFLPAEWQVLLTSAFSIFLILGVVRLFYKG